MNISQYITCSQCGHSRPFHAHAIVDQTVCPSCGDSGGGYHRAPIPQGWGWPWPSPDEDVLERLKKLEEAVFADEEDKEEVG